MSKRLLYSKNVSNSYDGTGTDVDLDNYLFKRIKIGDTYLVNLQEPSISRRPLPGIEQFFFDTAPYTGSSLTTGGTTLTSISPTITHKDNIYGRLQAMEFAGVTDERLECNSFGSYINDACVAGNYHFGCWIYYPSTPTSNHGIITLTDGTGEITPAGTKSVWIFLEGTNIKFEIRDGGGGVTSYVFPHGITTGWHFFLLQHENLGDIKASMDGVILRDGVGTRYAAFTPALMSFGSGYVYARTPYPGSVLGDVFFGNTLLTNTEIIALYNDYLTYGFKLDALDSTLSGTPVSTTTIEEIDLKLPLVLSDPTSTALTIYREYSYTTAMYDAATTTDALTVPATATVTVSKIGNIISLTMKLSNGTKAATNVIELDDNLPTEFCPSVTIAIPYILNAAGTDVLGKATVGTTGLVRFYPALTGNFTAGVVYIFQPCQVSYPK